MQDQQHEDDDDILISSTSASFSTSSSEKYEDDEFEQDQEKKQLSTYDLPAPNNAVEQEIQTIINTTTTTETFDKYDDDSFEIEETKVDKTSQQQQNDEENVNHYLTHDAFEPEEEEQNEKVQKRSLPIDNHGEEEEEDTTKYEDEKFESHENSIDSKENKPPKQVIHSWIQQKLHHLQRHKKSPLSDISTNQKPVKLFSANQINAIRESLKTQCPKARHQRTQQAYCPQNNVCKVPDHLMNRARVQRLLSMGIHLHLPSDQDLKQVPVRGSKRSLSTFCSVKQEHLQGKLATIRLENQPPPELKVYEFMMEMTQAQRKIYESTGSTSHSTNTIEVTRMETLVQLEESRLLREEANQKLCSIHRNKSSLVFN